MIDVFPSIYKYYRIFFYLYSHNENNRVSEQNEPTCKNCQADIFKDWPAIKLTANGDLKEHLYMYKKM